MGDLHAVPARASPEVPSTRMCHNEVGNGNVSVLVVSVKGYVVLMTANQMKQVWQQDKKDDEITTLTTSTPLVMMVSGGPELGNRKKNAFTITH